MRHRFAPALRRLAGELDLPHPRKVELLVEMAGDLEALYEHYRRKGLCEREAELRAAARIVPSETAAHHLARLHGGLYRTLLRRLGRTDGHRLETALGLGAAALLGYGALVVGRSGVPAESSAALWILIGLGMATLLYAARAGYGLFVRRELPERSDPASATFGLGGASLAAAVTSALLAFRTTAADAAAGELPSTVIIGRIGQHALLLSAGLALALAAGALGFLFAVRVAAMRRAELEYLLER